MKSPLFKRTWDSYSRKILSREDVICRKNIEADTKAAESSDQTEVEKQITVAQNWRGSRRCIDRKIRSNWLPRSGIETDSRTLIFDYRFRSMIYTTHWIVRLNRKLRGVLKNRSSMFSEESVQVLLGLVAAEPGQA